MKIYDSIVNENLLKEFNNPMGKTLMNHAFNACGIESYLAITAVLFPKIVEVNGCYFIAEFYNGNINSLEKEFNNDKEEIEKYVNSWSLSDFFLLARDESLDNDNIFEEFCKVIKYFWKLRLNQLLPDKNINVETFNNYFGEDGKTITVYIVR